jgi:glutathione-regulated potassium-efflux system protein KefB
MDVGVTAVRRETFLSSIELTHDLLRGLGLAEREVRFLLETFKAHDRRRLYEDYRHYTDIEKLQARARTSAQELEELFAQDATEQAKAEQEQKVS